MTGSMVTTISSELKLPFDYSVLPLVASHVRELARHGNLPQERSKPWHVPFSKPQPISSNMRMNLVKRLPLG